MEERGLSMVPEENDEEEEARMDVVGDHRSFHVVNPIPKMRSLAFKILGKFRVIIWVKTHQF